MCEDAILGFPVTSPTPLCSYSRIVFNIANMLFSLLIFFILLHRASVGEMDHPACLYGFFFITFFFNNRGKIFSGTFSKIKQA